MVSETAIYFPRRLDDRRRGKNCREIQGGGRGGVLPPSQSEMPEPIKSAQPASPPLQGQYWPVDRLIPSPRNARTHNAGQIAEIAGSIRVFGFTNPILVGESGDVIAGHGRLAAARQLGLGEVPVIPLIGLTELQRRELILADNRIALNSGWDLEMQRPMSSRRKRRSTIRPAIYRR